jgi:hypothetical protein
MNDAPFREIVSGWMASEAYRRLSRLLLGRRVYPRSRLYLRALASLNGGDISAEIGGRSRRLVDSRTDRWRRLVIPDLIDPIRNFNSLHRAPAGHEGLPRFAGRRNTWLRTLPIGSAGAHGRLIGSTKPGSLFLRFPTRGLMCPTQCEHGRQTSPRLPTTPSTSGCSPVG